MNPPTLLLSLLILAVLAAIVVRGVRNKKRGRHSCSCGGSCSGCPGGCHSHSR